VPLLGRGAWKNKEIFLGFHTHRLSLQSGHCKQDILHHMSIISTSRSVIAVNTRYIRAVSLVEKLQWLQNLQFVTEICYQNGTIFICMNKGTEARVPNLFYLIHKTKSYPLALKQIVHIEVD